MIVFPACGVARRGAPRRATPQAGQSLKPAIPTMFTLSAFADEISPDPQTQIDVLKSCGVRHIEFRSILGTNVLALSDLQIQEFKALLDANDFRLSAIGSPIGKIRIDEPFELHREKLKRAIDLCQVFGTKNIRVFSYYPPQDG